MNISCHKWEGIFAKHSGNSSLSAKQTVWALLYVMVILNRNQCLTDVFEYLLCAMGSVLGDMVKKKSASALDGGKKALPANLG